MQKACIIRGSPPTHPSICFHNLSLEFHCCWDFSTDKVLKKPQPTNKPALDTKTSLVLGSEWEGEEDSCFTSLPTPAETPPPSGWLGQRGGRGQGVAGGKGKGKRGKAKSVVPLEATLLRQCLRGTEKDLFRKHKSYFAHMDDNKAT